jgi:hypothetical protein
LTHIYDVLVWTAPVQEIINYVVSARDLGELDLYIFQHDAPRSVKAAAWRSKRTDYPTTLHTSLLGPSFQQQGTE